ncbi:MAG: MarC family protein [Acidimicrobiia bacterium]
MTFVLLLLAFVTVVNPARIHGALPAPGTRRGRVAVAGLGGAIALVVLVALAAVGDGLLDALDIDEASARIAAGLVLLVAGVRDLVARPPAAEPALPGWRAALVPVAVPLLLGPEVAVLALVAGANEGVASTSGTAAFAVAVVVATSLAPRELAPISERFRGVLARLSAAVLVVLAVDLTIDGILAV